MKTHSFLTGDDMKISNTNIRTSLAAAGMLLLILDSKTVVLGAKEGIEICLTLVIPSLFPYLFFSSILTSTLNRSGSLFLIGMLGGYPAGAQVVRSAYDFGNLSKQSAQRMLGYCNLAGPSFIFGMLSSLFTKAYIPWIIWAIHILTGFVPYLIFREKKIQKNLSSAKNASSISDILLRAVRSICLICAWVFLFRILLRVLETRFLSQFPPICRIVLSGILEMTNGCCKLSAVSEPIRFILCSGFLGFGGICVLLQTSSIVKELGIKFYLGGKLIHGILSTTVATMFLPIIF